MRIYQLEGFFHVGRTGGYTAAARAIPYPVGEPAIHQQVSRLEEHLDLRLVRREGKRIHLTPEGRALHDFVAPFFDRLPRLERRLRTGSGGTVIVAATDVVSGVFMAGRLAKIRKAFAETTVSVREMGANADVLAAVYGGGADFGVSHFPELPPTLRHRVAGRIEAVAIVPSRHPLARRRRLTLEEIAGHPLVAYETGSFPREVLEAAFRKRGLEPRIAVEASTSELQACYVREGLGISVVPSIEGPGRDEPGLARIPVPGVFPSYPLQVVWKGSAEDSSPVFEGIRKILSAG